MIELVIKVRFLKLNNPLQHVLGLVVAVFEDEVLRLFHLLHLIELVFEALHGVLGQVLLELGHTLLQRLD